MVSNYFKTMASYIFCTFVLLMMLGDAAEAKTRCFSVKGKLVCHANQSRAMDTEIYLLDDDGPMNPDDTMGWTTSDEDGSFKIEGCGYDFLSDPDPLLRIYNVCNGDTVVKSRVTLPQTFQPEIIDAGEIILDL